MKPSKFFLAIVTILIGLAFQLVPLLLTADSPKVAVGFPFAFLWEGPNEVYVGAYTFEKEAGFSVMGRQPSVEPLDEG